MAIDSRAKRQHVAGLSGLERIVLPHPDGSVDDIDRHYFGEAYIQADAPVTPPAPTSTTQIARPAGAKSPGPKINSVPGKISTVSGKIGVVSGKFRGM